MSNIDSAVNEVVNVNPQVNVVGSQSFNGFNNLNQSNQGGQNSGSDTTFPTEIV